LINSAGLLNGVVGAVVSGFEFAGRLVMDIGVVVKAAVGEGAAEAFVAGRAGRFARLLA
jgi:hypothetical protein